MSEQVQKTKQKTKPKQEEAVDNSPEGLDETELIALADLALQHIDEVLDN